MLEIIGHRGSRCYAPENTMPGFELAIAQGVDWVDVDVTVTSDMQLVAYHDLRLNPDILYPLGGGVKNETPLMRLDDVLPPELLNQRLIRHISLAELSKYQVVLNPCCRYARFFPRQQFMPNTLVGLQHVVDCLNKLTNYKVKLQIEVKNDLYDTTATYSPEVLAQIIYTFIVANNLFERVKIQAFDWRILVALTKLNVQIKTAYLIADDFYANWSSWYVDAPFINLLYSVLEPRLDIAHGKTNIVSNDLGVIDVVKQLGAYSFEPEDNQLSKEQLQYAHSLDLKVYVWPWPEHSGLVFNPQLMHRLLAWGVDGVITDDPVGLRDMVDNSF